MARQAEHLQALAANRQTALKIATVTGKKAMLETLKDAQQELQQRIAQRAKVHAAQQKLPFTDAQLQVMLRQVKDTMGTLKKGMRNAILDTGSIAAEASAQNVLTYMGAADTKFKGIVAPLALDEAMVMHRAMSGTESSILHRIDTDPAHPGQQGVLDRYGDATVANFEEAMRRGIMSGASVQEMQAMLITESPFLQGAPAYWAERIVRTESMAAYNRSGWEGMREVNEQTDGQMCKILSAVFDDRTAADSYAVHGQARHVDEAFETWYGMMQHPPARPNDREIVVPHRLSWPLPPELKPVSLSMVARRWKAEGRKEAMPPRPPLSTVRLKGHVGES